MKMLIIGSGGREHALAWRFLLSPRVTKVFVAPGNAGTEEVAENIAIAATDIEALAKFAKEHKIHLTIVGPEDSLAAGVVDVFQAAGLPIFGPSKALARLEASKSYAKELLQKLRIPTAKHKTFDNYDEAVAYVKQQSFPRVVKADGLALGKGAIVCRSLHEALRALEDLMVQKTLGAAGDRVVIESYLKGIELDIYVFSDGKSFHVMWPTQGAKPLLDGDKGPNTGSMGMVLPAPGITEADVKQISDVVVEPILSYLRRKGTPFVGLFHPGVMLTDEGPMVLEYNVRPGDPDTQLYARLIENDLVDIYRACVEGRLAELKPQLKPGHAISVSLVSQGYPGPYKKGYPIFGLKEAARKPNIQIFHGGTMYQKGRVVTNGGRVLHVTATGRTLEEAERRAYQAAKNIHFENMHMRHDIGKPLSRDNRTGRQIA